MEEFLELLKSSRRAVVLTGAGVSTASGIPDFRGPKGIYRKFPPDIFDIEKFYTNPERFYSFAKDGLFSMLDAKPNESHIMIAKLEEKGFIEAVITQNIDGLHQKAGSRIVLELHGNMSRFFCVSCKQIYSASEVREKVEKELVPKCTKCGSLIRPDVVFFGEPLPQEALQKAIEYSERADLMIVMGSSLVVYPAAYLPMITVENGGKLVIVNKGETGLDNIAFKKYDMDLVEFSRKILEVI